MIRNQFVFDLHPEMIVDNFAGGGGASTGIERALGRCVDVAINHDPEAIAMHSANHPQTRHMAEDVWDVDPLEVTRGRRVGLAWFSPDCKHFSKAKGGQPRSKKIRGLAWVVVKWAMVFRKAGLPMPRVMFLENVEEFRTWGPLLRDGKPCPQHAARTFNCFRSILTTGVAEDHPDLPEVRLALGSAFDLELATRGLGYDLETREIRASEHRTPTIRKRLYLIARCDGLPIVWPDATHGKPGSEGVRRKMLKPWRTAAECIDWSIPCRSIFERERPLAEATMRRIARGIRKFVIEAAEPFIVKVNHGGDAFRGQSVGEPLQTITSKHGWGVAVPHVTKFRESSTGFGMEEPFHTVTAGGEQARPGTGNAMGMVEATLAPLIAPVTGLAGAAPDRLKVELRTSEPAAALSPFVVNTANGKFDDAPSRSIDPNGPLPTITGSQKHALIEAHLMINTTGHSGGAADAPMHTIPSGGHHAVVETHLAPFLTEHANASGQRVFPADEPMRTQCGEVKGGHFAEVTAFLAKHYGGHETPGSALEKPVDTITSVDHNALVTATIVGCGGRMGQSQPRGVDEPVQTLTSKADSCLLSATLIGAGGPAYSGKPKPVDAPMNAQTAENHAAIAAVNLVRHFGKSVGSEAGEPVGTICAGGGGKTALVASHLSKLYGTTTGHDARDPMHTVTSGGNHIAEVRAFLIKYYGNEKEAVCIEDPMHTITAKDRIGLVTIKGEEYIITDIGMRMLEPHELYAAQGFPSDYIIAPMTPRKRGKKVVSAPLPKHAQVRMCGNSVCPPVAEALVLANVPEMSAWQSGERKRIA